MNKSCLTIAAALALAACGGGPQDAASAACEKKIAEQVAGKSFKLDYASMVANSKPAGENVVEINSTVCFDCTLPSEQKQGFTCRVRFDPANPSAEPAIVGFTFIY